MILSALLIKKTRVSTYKRTTLLTMTPHIYNKV